MTLYRSPEELLHDADPDVALPRKAASELKAVLGAAPSVALVLGSSQGDFVKRVENPRRLAYSDIVGMPHTSVVGHAGELVVGQVGGVDVAVFAGRLHMYEGLSAFQATFPQRLMAAWGVRAVALTNAAGGLDPSWPVGASMLIRDHINLTGRNPLVGPVWPDTPRFPDMSAAYDPVWAAEALRAADELGVALYEGVYAGVLGPTYETPAEIRMMRTMGAHAVGMSTVVETIAARALGLKVLAISTISNHAAGLSSQPLSHDEVRAAGEAAKGHLFPLLARIIAAVPG